MAVHRGLRAARAAGLLGALVAPLALGAAGTAEPAEASPRDPDPALPVPAPASAGLLERKGLTGDWGGLRPALAGRGVALDLLWTLDVMANVSGGIERGAEALGSFDLALSADLETLAGWPGAKAFVYGLGTYGGDPSDRVGDLQVVDDVEAFDTWKLYEAWLEQSLADGAISLRAGLYAVDHELDVIPAAEPLLNSSFGTGAALGSSGRNGPSIFPVTSLGARLEVRPHEAVYVRAVIADGVPGDPQHPRGTRVRFARGDGLFLAAELGVWNTPDSADRPRTLRDAPLPERAERRWGHHGKLAVGVWGYTSELDRFSPGPGGAPRTRRGTLGVYALAEQRVFVERRDPRQGLTVFARLGLADDAVNPLDADVEAGLVYRGALPGRGADRLAFGIAAAHLSEPFRDSLAAGGRRSDPWEVALELTYLARLTPWLTLQPDVQLVIDPGQQPGLANAWVVGGRLVVAF